MIKRYGASVSPCSTPAIMSKYSVSPSGERTFTGFDVKLLNLVSIGRLVGWLVDWFYGMSNLVELFDSEVSFFTNNTASSN